MKRGFTLIELLVAVLIISILAAVGIAAYKKAVVKARSAQIAVLIDSFRKARDMYHLLEEQTEGFVFYESGWDYEDGSVGEAHQNNLDKLGVDFPDLKELEQKYDIRITIRLLGNDPGLYLQIEPTDHGKGFLFSDYEIFTDGHRTICMGGGDIGQALAQMYHCKW